MNGALAALLGGLAGAIAGSFLATIILRWPAGRSILLGRSSCDGCGRVLGPGDLVPLLGAWLAGGRCRTCGVAIDPLHGRVELACLIIGALALGLRPGIDGMAWALLGWLLLTLAILDWRHFWLPDALVLPLAFLGFVAGPLVSGVDMVDRIAGAAIGLLSLAAIAFAYRRLRGREGLGLGDAKLLGAIGAWFGWAALPFILLLAALGGLAAVLLARLGGQAIDGASRVPLGTFLCAAAVPGAVLASHLLR